MSVIASLLIPLLIASPVVVDDGSSSVVAAVRARLAAKAPDAKFHIVVESPFVVVGDGSKRSVERYAKKTVRWAVDLLRRDYFERGPSTPIEIWLFKDETSYRQHLRLLFDEPPYTPYGFYSEKHGALLMNIDTGTGTLVHEIVHPFMAANFPECPAWLNEGLGSLFERAAARDGHIVGLPNWRLDGLQQAIRAGAIPSLSTLLSATERTFYEQDHGTNYAHARYLLYFVQERGLLRELVRRVRAEHEQDPTGTATLKAVLKVEDLSAFQAEWSAWVLSLRGPDEPPPRSARDVLPQRRRGGTPWGRPF